MALPEKLINQIENAGFIIYYEDEISITFGKFSSAGRDFDFDVENSEDLNAIANNILDEYNAFDVEEEFDYWLNSGYGNGAFYDRKTLYKDIEECKGFIYELYEIFKEYTENIK